MLKEMIFLGFLAIAIIIYIKLSSIKVFGTNLLSLRYRILLALTFPLIVVVFLFLGFVFAIILLLILILIFIFWVFTPKRI